MSLSRSARITLLLIIDLVFFFVELIAGYAVGSLALVADSFHMLNDVMSLVVALYAIKLTNENSTDSRYSYGWHRAEILAALINGVFLLALCFSITLEALERFFAKPEISNPKLVVIIGSLGLASNIVGLFLFHEHGHTHKHVTPSRTPSLSEPSSSMPETRTENFTPARPIPSRAHKRSHSLARSPAEFSSLYGHPAATRASLVQTAQDLASASPPGHRNSISSRPTNDLDETHPSIHSPVMDTSMPPNAASEVTPLLQDDLNIKQTRYEHSHSRGHAGSMNMRAIVLHVLGDALGNVGVIATGLAIWLSSWSFKFYLDPVISLVITVIIFSSALPLVRSASFILLQGVPSTVSLDEVKDSILQVEGVLSLHELHVWQLSETKIVASVHVLASRNHDFMPIAAKIRKELHHLGIHSSTIQPEYYISEPALGDNFTANEMCLILCPQDAECDPSENACCPPPSVDV